MYRGPFWAIIELQARWVASIFSGLSSIPSIQIQQAGLDMEHRIRSQQPRPQFPHSDFVGYADDLAKEIFDEKTSNKNDILLSTEFRTDGPDQAVIDEVNSLCQQANQGRFIAGAVFRALHESTWKFERILTGIPSDGIVNGQAKFSYLNQDELIYKEQGKLILSSSSPQIPLDITQKYLYTYDKSNDLLTVYFVNGQNQRQSLFHTIHFQPKQSSNLGWTANGEHLCSQDHYSAQYLFVFNGINLSRFEITYTVKGPAKDYTSKTVFQPESS